MTKNETLYILAMLNAFYGGGKNNPEEQVSAWHLILQKYDYEDAKEAVLRFAENDTRQYATFPAVGLIVKEIRDTEAMRTSIATEVIIGISYGRDYQQLSDKAKMLMCEETYNDFLKMDAELFSLRMGSLRRSLLQKQKQIEGK